jgi:RimJ/RimL family protein N-acetyltransferase
VTAPETIRTARLSLRRWRPADREPFATLNADPRVTRYLSGPLDRAASDTLFDQIEAEWAECDFGLWALELAGSGELIGFTGLHRAPPGVPFQPAVEVGWRLSPEHWDHGYATEAAAAVLADGFVRAGLAEVVSFTTRQNVRSQRVMRRLGMRRDTAGDFDHPALPPGHPLRPHVLYRLRAREWLAGR